MKQVNKYAKYAGFPRDNNVNISYCWRFFMWYFWRVISLTVITICYCISTTLFKDYLTNKHMRILWLDRMFPNKQYDTIFTARCTIMQSVVLRLHVVCPSDCPSVTLLNQDHISWKSWKLIAWIISPSPSLFVAQRPSTYFQGNMGKVWGD